MYVLVSIKPVSKHSPHQDTEYLYHTRRFTEFLSGPAFDFQISACQLENKENLELEIGMT